MPNNGQYRHQVYTAEIPASPYRMLRPGSFPEPGSSAFLARMQQVGRQLRRQKVAAVYLAHGTFAGSDALGVLAMLEGLLPEATAAAREKMKQLVDALAGERGNYTQQFAEMFEESINQQGQQPHIPVRRFRWSSENHHVGRADGAVQLICELARASISPGQRVLLWGHSHAGNVFALASNLLSEDQLFRDAFFHAAEVYYRSPASGTLDLDRWDQVRRRCNQGESPLPGVALDCVTFGTPIRYGWNLGCGSRLLHVVNHRPSGHLPEYRAAFPPTFEHIQRADGGDYVHQLGIAGTNFMPGVFSPRTMLADKRLHDLLQKEVRSRDLPDHLKCGMRVAQQGATLLVDYGSPEGNLVNHLAGHAVYTRSAWLLFHAEETATRLYAG